MSTGENGSANAYGWRWYVGGPIGGPLIALILGGLAGLTPAAYRRGMRTDDLISTVGWPGISPTYVESMLAVLVTAVGFLIVAVVFTYEQQRRTWRLSLDIGDGYRGWLILHAIMSLALIGWGTLLGLLSVTGIDEGGPAGRSAIVATAVGFAGLAQAAVLLFISVRMLTPERLAERVVRTPRGKRMENPAQRLMDLAIIEHRADDHIEYQKRLQAIRRLGSRTPDGDQAFAPDALRALLDIAIRIRDDRNPILMALKQSFDLLKYSDEVAQAVARNEPDKVVEKLETILADNLERRHPSATILKETLRLVSIPSLRLDGNSIYTAAFRGTVFRARPEDLWTGVQESILNHVSARGGSDAGTEDMTTLQWLVEALGDGTTIPRDRDEAQLGVGRIRGLLKKHPKAEESPTWAQKLDIRLLELLTASAEESGSTDAFGDKAKGLRSSLVRSVAQRSGRIPKGPPRKQLAEAIGRLPEPHRTTINMLAWVFRAQQLDDPQAMLAPEGPAMEAAVAKLGDDPEIALRYVRNAMGILFGDESPYDGKAAGYLEKLLRNKPELAGLAALPRLIALREMATRLKGSGQESRSTSTNELGPILGEAEITGSVDGSESTSEDGLDVPVLEAVIEDEDSGNVDGRLPKLLSRKPQLKLLAAISRLSVRLQTARMHPVAGDESQGADEVLDPDVLEEEAPVPSDEASSANSDGLGLTVLRAELEAEIGREGPQQQYFSKGLVHCREDAEKGLQGCRSLLPDPWFELEPSLTESPTVAFIQLYLVFSTAIAAHVLWEGVTATGESAAHGEERDKDVTPPALLTFARSMTWLLAADRSRDVITRSLRSSPAISEQILLDGAAIVAATSGYLERNSRSRDAPGTLFILEVVSGFRRLAEVCGRQDTDARKRLEAALREPRLQVDTPAMHDRISKILVPLTPSQESVKEWHRLDRTSVPDGALRQVARRLTPRTEPFLDESFIVHLVTWVLKPIPQSMSFSDTIADILRALSARADSLRPSLDALLADLSLHSDLLESIPSPVMPDISVPQNEIERNALDDLILVERLTGWWRSEDMSRMSASQIIERFRNVRPDLTPVALATMLRNGNPLREEDLVGPSARGADASDSSLAYRGQDKDRRADVEMLEEQLAEVRAKIDVVLALDEDGDLNDEAGLILSDFERRHLEELQADEDDLEQQLAEMIAESDTPTSGLGPVRAAPHTSGNLHRLAIDAQAWIERVQAVPVKPTNQQQILILGLPKTESRTSDVHEYRSQMLAALHGVAHIALVRSGSSQAAEKHLNHFQAWEEDTPASKTVRLRNAHAGSLPEPTD